MIVNRSYQLLLFNYMIDKNNSLINHQTIKRTKIEMYRRPFITIKSKPVYNVLGGIKILYSYS